MRLVFLGDSLTWGGYGGSFVAEIAARCPQHEIINAGAGGNTVINLLRRLDDVLRGEPDGVFAMVGGNDALSHSQPAMRGYYRKSQEIPGGDVPPDLFARAYRDLLTRIRLAHILAWVGLEPVEYSPELVAALRDYNTIARQIAESLRVPVLDLMTYFPPNGGHPRPPLTQKSINLISDREKSGWADYEAERQRGGFTFSFDGVHFTPDAARRAAQIIIDFLELEKRP
jgi:lysophospholipase L1-like esterase